MPVKTTLVLFVLLLAALFGACREEEVVYDAPYLEVSTESDLGVAALDLTFVQIAEGQRYLANKETGEGYSVEVGWDLLKKKFVIRIDRKTGDPDHPPFIHVLSATDVVFEDTDAAYVHILGRNTDGQAVAVAGFKLDLTLQGQVPVTLQALAGKCDLDGDGTPDCGIDGCCDEDYEPFLADCNDNDPAVSPIAWEIPACVPCENIPDYFCLGSTASYECTCQAEAVCSAASCVADECQETALDCNDNDPCTTDACDPATGCTAVPVDCDDDEACTADACNPNTGVCEYTPACGDCDTNEECDDENPCTDDRCDVTTGACEHTPNTATCSDGSLCTKNDGCIDGECIGTPINCEDGSACTTEDTCHPGTGLCIYTQADCDDGVACTVDSCDVELGCVNTPDDGTCPDGDLCAIPTCDVADGCTYVPVDCNDGNECTTDACDPETGDCIHIPSCPICTSDAECNDDNSCTDDTCDPATGCVNVDNTAPCDDANACTEGDTCQGGECVGGSPADCNDNDPCTTDSCDPVEGCVNMGECPPCLSDAECDDENVCTDDACNPAVGCINTPQSGACEDGNGCTGNDACQGGTCVGGTPINCDDGNACTADECFGGGCVHSAFSCDDGIACTNDSCDAAIGCVNAPVNGLCDDGDACTLDLCSETEGCQALPIDCNDGNACTDDVCDPVQGCVYTSTCPTCESDEECDDGNPCTADACDTVLGCVNALPDDPEIDSICAPCDDGNPCTVPDVSGLTTTCEDIGVDPAVGGGGACLTTANAATSDSLGFVCFGKTPPKQYQDVWIEVVSGVPGTPKFKVSSGAYVYIGAADSISIRVLTTGTSPEVVDPIDYGCHCLVGEVVSGQNIVVDDKGPLLVCPP
ncbi:MAG TPA: hypothetical protein DCY48_00830 [Candidatus Magasanikbacteria bacterium]|nr:MAG: hypothetical protein A3I74_02410 [Candidatus Magasanikbacteria bacterium RIFCSPLOWO2_02_FULL_47_16]OGH79639.1 MAG: hypothetical protein A3C10_00990 [Candidatus Magasanikbacteria bacterium RIFCSPHIGHO2_02_FULL_48_18]OGH82341.1 MAG: hypothetical protein A3G08_03175 [Candidatus Magasanikbacteria bacterium RIFCSPLOWO2_12_FULL_47_9b]HAZ28305.1 hypothetical protein [Candidatus Magasanikbacteria bacterium]